MTAWPLRTVVVPFLFAVPILALGCGSEGESKAAATGAPSAKQSLEDMVSLLNYLKSENKPPPAKVADIEPIEPLFQSAYLGLVRGEIEYLWGTMIDPAGADKVLAFEKAADTTSGWVLMQDGSLKTMDSTQFKAASKAAK
jgi:hypothetical protein